MSGRLIANLEKRFASGTTVSASLVLPVDTFSITVLFGPSGCGKTTVLRSLAGLERPESGRITYNDETWFDAARSICLPPQQRDIGFGFQDYALFPHLTVRQNIGYGLRTKGSERDQAITSIVARLQLEGLQDRFPHQISGGQQQRVALARVLARRPRLLLLDEPLSALDATLRDELRVRLRQLLGEFGRPVVLVTHDRMEAIALADQLVVIDEGRILQRGTVEEIFSRPHNSRVARIVGIESILPGEILAVEEGMATIAVRGQRLTAVAPPDSPRSVHVCIRGENVTLQKGKPHLESSRNRLAGTICWITPEGPLVRIGIDCGFELTSLVTRSASIELGLTVNDPVTATIKASAIHLVPR